MISISSSLFDCMDYDYRWRRETSWNLDPHLFIQYSSTADGCQYLITKSHKARTLETSRSNCHTLQLRKQTGWDYMMCLLRLGQDSRSPNSHCRASFYLFHLIIFLFTILMKQQIFYFLSRVKLWTKRNTSCATSLCAFGHKALFVSSGERRPHSGCSYMALRNYFSLRTRPKWAAESLVYYDWWISISISISLLSDIVHLEICLQTHEAGWGRERHSSTSLTD